METRSNYVMVGAVTLAILAGLLLFTVWLAGVSGERRQCYDIYFAQGVSGLNRGSPVTFSGVPVGQVSQISLLPERPELVWVRIDVNEETPILQGTTAQVRAVSLTGGNEVQLSGAIRGRERIRRTEGRECGTIPASTSGLGALLASAPELMERIQRLTERLTELLNDRNQNAISDILENIQVTTDVLRQRAPELGDAIADARLAVREAGVAAQRVGVLADSTTALVNEEGRPAAADLRRTIASVERAATNLDAMVADARPGVQSFSKSTLPEANRLISDLRELTTSLRGVSERIEQGGIGGALGPEKLPDYDPRNRR